VGQHVGICHLIVIPVLALAYVAGGEFPVLLLAVDPPQEACPLLLLRQVEEELDDPDAVIGKVVLPVVDLPVPASP
jgi:hypothetical protein